MCSCINESQRQNIILNQIYQQPVRFDVAFTEAFKVASQRMITILLLQWYSLTKLIHYIINER